MAKFWKSDWFTGLVISVVFIFIADSSFINKLEYFAYDHAIRQIDAVPGKQIAIIAIDDQSIENLGRWPWSRSLFAKTLKILQKARVIGNTILLSEPQKSPGLPVIEDALSRLEAIPDKHPQVSDTIDQLRNGITSLETDKQLATAIRESGNVIMSMILELGTPAGKPDSDLPDFISKNIITHIADDTQISPFLAKAVTPPIAEFGMPAEMIGHLNNWVDPDGGVRSDMLVIDYFDHYLPSLSLLIAAKSLNLGIDDISINVGKSISLGKLLITTDEYARMTPFYYHNVDKTSPFQIDSFYDVYEGKINAEKYKDKIVLIGATATGLGTSWVTPVSEAMKPVLVLANRVASILNQQFIITPEWGLLAETLLFLLVAIYLMLVLPRLKAGMAAIVSLLLLIMLTGTNQFLLINHAMWLQIMAPTVLLVSGYILLISKRYLMTERGKFRSEQASAESNRTLGLAYQQQGQLDMALDKFRQCPMDDNMLEPLYNLARDFERKRQFNKATSVYEYMAEYQAAYKDIKHRIKRSKAMQDTVMFGAAGAGQAGALMLEGDGVQKPMLGRYEVEKELGKGAMGVVYLGKDPKINRVVAIKTMALAQEFEEDELDEVKARFFREAETAGRLTHPNIVTIYDAGEEHDLAYIAMEFLDGHDLMRYTKKDKLLPVRNVIQLVALAADALNYAHQQNVVHRDIKPANVMYVPAASTIKLTDFGIARITDSSKTKTGLVLGTPSYMSPEQLAGKKVDGRSDLFSLGVMFYQLLCGELPFRGDSMAALMFMIANEPHPDISRYRAELVKKAACLFPIIDKILDKSPDKRYQTGGELLTDLRNCLRQIKK